MTTKIKRLLLIFPLLTIAGLILAAYLLDVPLDHFIVLPPFDGVTWALLLTTSFMVYIFDAWRFKICGAMMGIQLPWVTCIEASIVNLVFAWITPGGALGAPSGGAILRYRQNVGWDDSMVIAFGKSISGIMVIIGMAIAVVLIGYGPDMSRNIVLWPLVFGVMAYGAIVAFCLAGAYRPQIFKKFTGWLRTHWDNKYFHSGLGFIESTVEKFKLFQQGGRRHLPALLISNLGYFSVFVFIAAGIAYKFGARPLDHAFGISVVKVAATFVAPTPGGAGFSEATAEAFYGGVLPGAAAVSAVLFFRFFTFYFQIAVGLIHYFLAIGIPLSSADFLQKKAE